MDVSIFKLVSNDHIGIKFVMEKSWSSNQSSAEIKTEIFLDKRSWRRVARRESKEKKKEKKNM